MGAPSKRAKNVRVAKEFDLARLEARLRMPRDGRTTIDAWSFREIYEARNEQMLGQFVRPARMCEQMRTDEALFTAYSNRLAPQACIPVKIEHVPGARGESIGNEAEGLFGPEGVGIHAATIKSIHGCLVDHGVAFATCEATPREDGSRVDFAMRYWPIEYVRWDPVYRVFRARADPNSVQPGDIPVDLDYGFSGAVWIPIVHGDGRWIIFSDYEIEPFRQNAAILPAALVWARHAFAARDWSRGSKAHGSAKVVGELPAGVPLQGADGNLSPEAGAFVELLRSIAVDDAPAGIRPAGSKTDFLTNTSMAWQVWAELMNNAEKGAARIYLGTDGTLGTQGGAPGVDIESLFGVAATKVRGDLEVISRGINSGLIEPWCAINFGDSKLAPKRKYLVPNDEEESVTDAYAKRNAAYTKALVDFASAGLILTPYFIVELAKDYRVRPPSLLAAPAPVKPAENGPVSAPTVGARATPTATTIALDYNPDEPREPDGKFGSGGGAVEKPSPEHHAEEKAKEAAHYFKTDPGRLQRVRDYTDSRAKDGYRSINSSLRAGNPTPAAMKLTEDMRGAPKFSGEVHRSAVVPKAYAQDLKDISGVPHTAVKANSFWSSSRDEKVARGFARPGDKKDGQVRLMMHMQTHSGVPLESVSRIKGEQEVLISPGTRFRVTKAEKKGDVLHVHMQEL